MALRIELCVSPALYPYYKEKDDIVVVVDVFRATTTMCAAIQNGASAIIPVSDIDVAKRYKAEGFLVGAERNTRKCDFADFGNSPFEYTAERVREREIVFTTTNGTHAIESAKDARQLLIGAFSNIDAVAKACVQADGRVVVLCAGWNDKINLEDTLFGGALYEKLDALTTVAIDSDAVRVAHILWQKARRNPIEFLRQSDHYARLEANGFADQATYCFAMNTTDDVLFFDKIDGKIKRKD